ncbi:formin-1-like [Metopolophium dirhodum]|uniref:formin-1-like n=1 Tax=Metopolophium dirhodum TaxID=44670 RepID=UPI0029905DC9|nr:formin-1-like [Metopolophium dirhodum]
MADCPQFQLMPQVVPIYRPQPPLTQPPPPPNAFPMPPGQPIFPMPPPTPQFGYPPMAWSPVHQYPPPPPLTPQQPAPDHTEVDDDYDVQQLVFNNNNNNNYSSNKNISSADNLQIDSELQSPQRQNTQNRQLYSRNVSNKFDTRHEEFRKYLEEVGILSTFTNILSDMYQDPFRPNDPLGYIRDKLSSSRPETIELKNLRIWCEQYQTKTIRLEKELKHVIERLRKYEPYITDDSLLNESSTEKDCNSCVSDVSKLVLESKKENAQHGSRKNYN